MTVRRRDSVATVGAGSSVAAGIPAREGGDLLFAYVGGGNQVTSASGGWTSVQHTTGVEAQGELLWRAATNDSGDDLTLNFDGSDPYRVVVAAYYSTRGYALLHEIASTSRQGTTVGTLPAVSFTTPVTGNAGNLVDTYIFTRNNGTVPTVAPGSLIHSATASHAFGFWEDTRPDLSTDLAIDLPVRTGHFRASVRVFEWEWTGWRDDSVPFNAGTVAYVNPTTLEGGVAGGRIGGAERVAVVDGSDAGAQHTSVSDAWADTTDPNDGMVFAPLFSGIVRNVALVGEDLESVTDYSVYWLTGVRTAPGTATSGLLPDTVYDGIDYVDPLVFGEEWEPTDEPVSNELAINVRDIGGEEAELYENAGRPLHVKLVTGGIGSGVYDPDGMSGNALAALDTWHTIDVPSGWTTGDTLNGAWFDHGLPLSDTGGRFAVALVDDFTQTGTLPPTYSGAAPSPGAQEQAFIIQWAYEVFLQAYMAPRYRLKREVVGDISVIRQWPRDDSLGVNAVTRVYPPPRARRIIGGQP